MPAKKSVSIVCTVIMFACADCFQTAFAEGFPGKGSKNDWQLAWSISEAGLKLEDAGNSAGAIKKYQEAISIYRYDAGLFVNMANILALRKDHQGAVVNFENATVLDPVNFDAFDGLAEAYYDLKKLAASEKAYRKALDLQPTNYDVLFNLTTVLIEENRFEEATKFLARARSGGGKKDELDELADTIKKKKIFYPNNK